MSDEKIFADGFIAKRSERAPEWVITNLSVKVSEAVEFLNQHQREGWCNLQVKRSQGGKLYVELDTWQPTQGQAGQQGIQQAKQAASPQSTAPSEFDDDIPF